MTKRRSALQRQKDKYHAIRAEAFPDVKDDQIWNIKDKHRTKGFTPIPRAMPLIGVIMDNLSGKGKPVSGTYLELWCRSFENGFLILSKPRETAFASGFSGERAISTWKQRIRKLEELEFIKLQSGAAGEFNYVQILNPYHVIEKHKMADSPGFSRQHYMALKERYIEIGATDLDHFK